MRFLGLFTFFLLAVAPHLGFAQAERKVPVAVSHEGKDQVGQSVARVLEETISASQRFLPVAENTPRPRIIINLESTEALAIRQLQGQISAIAISIIYYRTGMPGVGIFLGQAVNSCSPEIISACVKNIIPHLERATDFLKRHDPDLWNTL